MLIKVENIFKDLVQAHGIQVQFRSGALYSWPDKLHKKCQIAPWKRKIKCCQGLKIVGILRHPTYRLDEHLFYALSTFVGEYTKQKILDKKRPCKIIKINYSRKWWHNTPNCTKINHKRKKILGGQCVKSLYTMGALIEQLKSKLYIWSWNILKQKDYVLLVTQLRII